MSSIFTIADLHIKSDGMTILKDTFRDETNSFLLEKVHEDDLLLICGDLINQGGSSETEKVLENARDALDFFCSFKCPVMFIPGNHDISDELNDGTLTGKYSRVIEMLKLTSEKHANLLTSNISTNHVVVSHYEINEFLIIGLNSTCSIGKEHGSGYIDAHQLKDDLDKLKNEIPNFDSLHKVVVTHHNFFPYGNNDTELEAYNRDTYNGNMRNSSEIKNLLNDYGVDITISGHTHGNQTVEVNNYFEENNQKYITVGSLEIQGNDSISMSEFKLSNSGKIYSQSIYAFTKVNNHGKWSLFRELSLDSSDAVQLEDYHTSSFESASQNKKEIASKKAEEFLKKSIQEKRLLKTGHFCVDNECTLTWIDTTPYIVDASKLNEICIYFISKFDELKEADVFIGIGMKGTIIANALSSYCRNAKVVYWPDENVVSDETYMTSFFKNDLSNYRKPFIITDVYSTGGTIQKVYNKFQRYLRNADFSVLCIFIRSKLRCDNLHVAENNFDLKRYKIRSLYSIPSISCSYTPDQCPIYKDNLCEIRF